MSTISKNKRVFANKLKNLAEKVPDQQKHAAILFQGSRILSFGVNNYSKQCSPKDRVFGFYSIHAEYAAIKKSKNNKLKSLSLIVVRLGPGRTFLESTPCSKCFQFLKANGIKKIFASNSLGEVRRVL